MKKVFNENGDLIVRFAFDAKEQITKWLDGVDYDYAVSHAKEVDCSVFGKSLDFPCVSVQNVNTEKIKEVCTTDLEMKFLICLIEELYAEPGFSDVGIEEISKKMKISKNKAKGVLGSLVKKNILFVDEYFKDIVYLHSNYWYLHPEWHKVK